MPVCAELAGRRGFPIIALPVHLVVGREVKGHITVGIVTVNEGGGMPIRVMALPPGEFIRRHLVDMGGMDYVQAIHKAYKAHLRAQGLKDQACRASMSVYIWQAHQIGLIVFDHASPPERWGAIEDGVSVHPGYVRESRPYAPSPRHYYRIVDPTDPRWVRLGASYRESIGLPVVPPAVPRPPPVARVPRVPKPPKPPKPPKVPKPLKPPKVPKVPKVPRVPVSAAPYEARALEIAALVEQLPAAPSLEAIGEIENLLVDLGYEVIAATRKAKGVERERLSALNTRLRHALEVIGPLRASLHALRSETLPRRIETAQRSLAATVRLIIEALRG